MGLKVSIYHIRIISWTPSLYKPWNNTLLKKFHGNLESNPEILDYKETTLPQSQVRLGFVLMGWSLLPDALRPFKNYCASPSLTSQLVLFLQQTVKIDPLGHVGVVEALQNFVQKYNPMTLSEIHIHIAGVQQFHCR